MTTDRTRQAAVIAVGDNVVDQYPDLGVMYPGGNAVNVAVNARRLGARAAYLGVLGSDRAGAVVREALRSEGLDLTHTRVADGPNAHATVRVHDGNRVFEGGEIGVSRFRLTAHDVAALGDFDVVHTGECSMTEEDLPRMRAAARMLSFDFSERPWDYVVEHARHAHVAVLSTPHGDPTGAGDLARRVLGLGPALVAVTMGPAGAVVADRDGLWAAPAGRGPIVDTLGAGDAFIARLLVGLAHGEHPATVVTAATDYASKTCATYGAFGHETPITAPEGATAAP